MMLKGPPTTFRIIGLVRVFEIWKDNEWQRIDPIDLDNGTYILRIRYTDEDQEFVNKQNA